MATDHPDTPAGRLGLPESGPGSMGTLGQRVGAFAIDAVVAALAAGIFTAPELPRNWSLLSFGVLTLVGYLFLGRTLGMNLVGLRLAGPDPSGRLAPWRAVLRTALLMLLIPVLLSDRNNRGMHDRAAGTIVVRA